MHRYTSNKYIWRLRFLAILCVIVMDGTTDPLQSANVIHEMRVSVFNTCKYSQWSNPQELLSALPDGGEECLLNRVWLGYNTESLIMDHTE